MKLNTFMIAASLTASVGYLGGKQFMDWYLAYDTGDTGDATPVKAAPSSAPSAALPTSAPKILSAVKIVPSGTLLPVTLKPEPRSLSLVDATTVEAIVDLMPIADMRPEQDAQLVSLPATSDYRK